MEVGPKRFPGLQPLLAVCSRMSNRCLRRSNGIYWCVYIRGCTELKRRRYFGKGKAEASRSLRTSSAAVAVFRNTNTGCQSCVVRDVPAIVSFVWQRRRSVEFLQTLVVACSSFFLLTLSPSIRCNCVFNRRRRDGVRSTRTQRCSRGGCTFLMGGRS